MDFLVEVSRNCNLALKNKKTKSIQMAINKSWITSSVVDTPHCVYFIQMGIGGYIKIGRSKRPTGYISRLVNLQTANPVPCRSLVEVSAEDYNDFTDYDRLKFLGSEYSLVGEKSRSSEAVLETSLHKRFKEVRGLGEWFYPSVDLLNFILETRNYLSSIGKLEEYNIKKSAIVQCLFCDAITTSSTLKCCRCQSKVDYTKCVWCGLSDYKPKWKRYPLCGDCYSKYVKGVRKLHRKLFV